MGGIIEKPGEKVSRSVEEGGDDSDKREIGEAGTEVAADEEDETDKGEKGTRVLGLGFVPMNTGEDVKSEGESVEAGDKIEERGEGEEKVEDD